MIKVNNLTFGYTQKKVLKNIDFSLSKGDFCALVGANGSGKSTLLKAIAGLLSTEASSAIEIENQTLTDISPRELAKKIAYVPQRQDVIFDFSVFDVVMMGRHPYQNHWSKGDAQDYQIVEEMLHKTNLIHLKDKMLTQLSGGEMQRTMIARAMAQQTPILLLDEPLSNLDITHKFEIMDILQELNQQEKVSIIIILHDFSFVKKYSSKTLIISDGTVQNYGNTNEVFKIENLQQAFQFSSNYFMDEHGNIMRK